MRRIRPGEWVELRDTRLAALADAPSAFASTTAREAAFGDEEWRERAHAAAEGAERATFLAREGARVVGLVGGFRAGTVDGAVVELVSMWTDPRHRRRGVGRALVRAVVDWAATTGAERVELWVTQGNAPAQQLYEAMGFVPTGDHQPLPSDPCRDERRMVRRLVAVGRG